MKCDFYKREREASLARLAAMKKRAGRIVLLRSLAFIAQPPSSRSRRAGTDMRQERSSASCCSPSSSCSSDAISARGAHRQGKPPASP